MNKTKVSNVCSLKPGLMVSKMSKKAEVNSIKLSKGKKLIRQMDKER